MNDLAPIVYKPRRGLSQIDAAIYVGVSSSKFNELVKDGTMPKPIRLGGRVIWDIRALDAAFEALVVAHSDGEKDSWSDA